MSGRLVAVAVACSLAGCGFSAPSQPQPPPAPVQQAQRTHEYPSPAQPPQHAATASASAAAAVRNFAAAYINWDAGTVTGRLRDLAADSVGQARSAMQLAAAQAAGDYELRRGGIANHGTVEAVAALQGSAQRFAVVTREWTTASLSTAYQGLRPAWHVTVATVMQQAPGQWVVSCWQPES